MRSIFNVKVILSLTLILLGFNYSFAQFEENKGQIQDYEGQTASFVNFTFTSGQNNIYLLEKGLAYQLKRIHYPEGFEVADKFTKGKELEEYEATLRNIKIETFRVDLELVGANEDVQVVTSGRSHDYSNYYTHDAVDVHSFSKVCYKNVYDGIDWVVQEKDGSLKYEFIVHPGADPSTIRLRYHHQNDLKIDSEGKLVLQTSLGEIIDEAPISFQGEQDINSSYALDNGEVFFLLGDYDSTKKLVIDPLSRMWGTYYGNTGNDVGNDCNTDASNNSYLAGTTTSSSGIASGGHDVTYGLNNDAFLVKFNAAGVRQWATYYGNNGENYGNSCVADALGNVYLAGSTSSSSLMTSGGHQNGYGGSTSDAFLVKFNAAGVRQWGTMYGGSNLDWGNGVDVDPSNNVYLAGSTRSTNNIYASPGFQSTAQGGVDAFLVKFNTAGVRQWGTYHGTDVDDVGGGEWTEGWDVAVSSTGYVYMVGLVNYNLNGEDAAYVVRFAWSGNAARSYNFEHGLNTNPVALGGVADGTGNSTRAYGVAVDGTGNVYMGGECDFGVNGLSLVSTSYTHQSSSGGGVDGFLVKLNFALTPQWKTLYGGTGYDGVNTCARQGSNIYIGGRTASTTNIANGGFQNTKSTGNDGFLVNFNFSGVRQWGTYYGGNGSDQGNGCAGDGTGAVYLAGTTASTNNIANGGHDNSKSTGNDAFLVKFSTCTSGTNTTSTAAICESATKPLTSSSTGGSWSIISGGGSISGTTYTPANIVVSTNVTVQYTDACGNTSNVTFTVNPTPTANAGPNQTTTCTNPTQVLSGSGGGTYSWSPATGLSNANIANPTANPASTQTYTLTVTSNGCTDTDAVTVTVNETPPTANAGPNQTTTCTTPTQVLNGSGGGSYSWSPATGLSNANISNPTANPASTQTYTLTVTGLNGCTDTDAVTVTVNETPPTANAGANQTTTCTNPTQVLSGSGGGTYSWSPATGLSNASIANPTADPASTQTYTLTVTGSNGCTDTDAVTVTVNETSPTANAGANQTTTCTNPTQVLSGSGGGSYSWSPATGLSNANIANPTANPVSTQTYTLTVTGSNGCTDTDAVTVTVDETAPTANAGANQTTTCTNPTQVLSGSGGGSYSWSPATGLSNANIANPTANPVSTQTYTLTVTGANGCTDTDAVTVTVDETAPTANAGPNQTTTCTNPTQVLSGSGGGSYNWSPATGLSNANISNPTANPASTQTYTLTVTGLNGCTDTDAVTVTVNETPPTANAGANQTTTCTNPTQVLSGSGGGSYSWSPATGLSNANISNPTANPASTQTYTLTVTGLNGCTDTDAVTVTVNETPPTANAGANQTTTCTTPTQVLNGSGGGSYSWSPATGLSNPNIANPTADPASSTTYTLTVTAANGCTNTDAVTITVDETPPTANAGPNQTTTCTNPTQVLNASGGGSYSWSPSTGLSNPNIASPTADPASTQTYTVTVTGANGCTATDAVTVTVDESAPSIDAGTDQTINCGVSSVTLNAVGTGTFSWSPATDLSDPNISNPVASPTTPTTYTVTLTGANGCTATDVVQVDVDADPTTSAAGPNQTICVALGTATLAGNAPTIGTGIWTQVSGPTSTITTPNSENSAVTGMSTAGTYVYEWTISNAPCPSSTDQVTIQVDLDADATFNFASPTYCQSNANDTANITGNTGGTFSATPAGLSIDASTGIIDFSASNAGSYTVSYTITGVCGATSSESLTIEASPIAPIVNTTSGLNEICAGEQLELVGSGSGTGATYNVYDAATNGTLLGVTPLMVSPSSSTTYYVEAVGSNGCTSLGALSPFAITVNAAPTVDAGSDQALCPGFSANLTATGAPDFAWSTSETTATITVSPAVTTNYYVTGTSIDGCTAQDSVLVAVIDPGLIDAVDDQYTVTTGDQTILDVSINDISSSGFVTIISGPTNGQAIENGDGTITYTSNTGYTGPDSFQYTICDDNCNTYCDTATVLITVNTEIDIEVSGGFSPNDDGINESFNILGLEQYPENKLSVYNRWGSLIYMASPYENDWNGSSNAKGVIIGGQLPTGTYLYVLELDAETQPMTGTLELKRD